jgi:hypothetical protein
MGGQKEREKEGKCGRNIFVLVYEKKTMKPVEIVLRREGGEKRQNN